MGIIFKKDNAIINTIVKIIRNVTKIRIFRKRAVPIVVPCFLIESGFLIGTTGIVEKTSASKVPF